MEKLKNLNLHPRLPEIIQDEAGDCGLACITMILNYHRHLITLNSLREKFNVPAVGLSVKEIIEISEKMGLTGRPFRVELQELYNVKVPCILHWSFNHFVVLKTIKRAYAIIHDPACGCRKISLAELSDCFTGIAIELQPGARFEKKRTHQCFTLQDMFSGIDGKLRLLFRVLLISCAVESLTLLIPIFIQFVIDTVLQNSEIGSLTLLMALFISLVFIRSILSWCRAWAIASTKYAIGLHWSEGLFTKLVSLPVSFFEKRNLGEMASRMHSLDEIKETFTARTIGAILDLILIILLSVIMFSYNTLLFFLVLLLAAIYVSFKLLSFTRYRSTLNEMITSSAAQYSFYMETVKAISVIKILRIADIRKLRWLNLCTYTASANIRLFRIDFFSQILSLTITGITAGMVIYVGAHVVDTGGFTTGAIFAFMQFSDLFMSRLINFSDALYQFRLLPTHTKRLGDIALAKSENFSGEDKYCMVASVGLVEVKNLCFTYTPSEPPIFENVTFSVSPGESLAIVGRSGCGKSTLLSVLASLRESHSGSILIDGVPLQRLGLDNYRSMISFVMQDDFLLSGTLQQNITSFSDRPDIEHMKKCAQAASIHKEVETMPLGYSTLIGELGSSLSGGQKQRISLARALYRKPAILILDEATSALDVENERRINEAIKSMKITRIFAAHRPDAIAVADKIYSLPDNKVINKR